MVFAGPLISDEFPAPNSFATTYPTNEDRRLLCSILKANSIFWALIAAAAFVAGGTICHSFLAPNIFRRVETVTSTPTVVWRRNGRYEHNGLITLAKPMKYPQESKEWRDEHYKREFEAFQKIFKVQYATSEEERRRFELFKSNLLFIMRHNERGGRYRMAINQFGDKTSQEFAEQVGGLLRSQSLGENSTARTERLKRGVADQNRHFTTARDVPDRVDWRLKNCVTPVKNQEKCGSCWAFSTTGAIEGAICVQTGALVSLSEQQLVDCSGTEGNEGCNGGEMDLAFEYVLNAGGLCTETEYPYIGKGDACHSLNCSKNARIVGYHDIPQKSVSEMKRAVAHYGPVAVAIEADMTAFQFYHDGIFDEKCGKDLNHAVLLVGYEGDQFWIVKNSWGTYWGDHGYVLMAMLHHGRSGECGILLDGSVPIIEGEEII